MFKKGQITVFIIIGIVILGIVASILFFRKETTLSSSSNILDYSVIQSDIVSTDAPTNAAPVKDFVLACLDQEQRKIVFATAVQGGYFGYPDDFLRYDAIYNSDYLYVPYYLNRNQVEIINKTRMEEEISFGLSLALPKCTNFSMFSYEVQAVLDQAKINTKITENTVVSDIHLPIIIKESGTYKEISDFKLILPSSLFKLYSAASEITSEQMKNKNFLCVSCMNNIMSKYNIDLNTIQTEDEKDYIILYSLSDLQQQLSFNFAHQISTAPNYEGRMLNRIPSLNATIGMPFIYEIGNPNHYQITDNSDLFEIEENGVISFTPTIEDIGKHIIVVTATDKENYTQDEVFSIDIQGENSWEIENVGNIYAPIGKETTYQVKTIPSIEAKYEVNSDLVSIDPNTGLMNIHPTKEKEGDYQINIMVTDSKGTLNQESFNLIISE
jgi:hypothetical protein